MTYDEFIAEYQPRPNDDVCPCSCGACDCPGWKLVDRVAQRQYLEAMERLPDVMIAAAKRAGERAGAEMSKKFWNEFLK